MRISMTKNRVIKALQEQPEFTRRVWCEASDAWIEQSGSSTPRIKDDPNCEVCAVGAVVRHVLNPSTKLTAVRDMASDAVTHNDGEWDAATSGDAVQLAADGKYLTALSAYFEQLPERSRQSTIRRKLIAFVTKHFPARIVLDINGYRRRKGLTDIKVVRGKR